MTYVIALPCVDVKDRACVLECPVDCVHEGTRALHIDPKACVDCRACEPARPVDAIFREDELPPQWTHCASADAEFFTGSVMGGREPGPAREDLPAVAALPARSKTAIAVFPPGREAAEDAAPWFPS
ncbi:ferredoxin [Streptomyces sp. NPDC013178]|uniref:ferredoxin n=1 Tax=Streptomyces sp. NPDC013178 TaxID=3155118 RepID=UPI0033D73E2A